jgi:hypothetical protein
LLPQSADLGLQLLDLALMPFFEALDLCLKSPQRRIIVGACTCCAHYPDSG